MNNLIRKTKNQFLFFKKKKDCKIYTYISNLKFEHPIKHLAARA